MKKIFFLMYLMTFALGASDKTITRYKDGMLIEHDKAKKTLTAYHGGYRDGFRDYYDTFVTRNLVDGSEKIRCTVNIIGGGWTFSDTSARASDVLYLRYMLDEFTKQLVKR